MIAASRTAAPETEAAAELTNQQNVLHHQSTAKLGRLGQAALALAASGWQVIPLHPRSKRPIGQFAPHGLHSASSDVDAVRLWWSRIPNANVAVRVPRGVVVFDLDVRNAALDGDYPPTVGTLRRRLERALGELPDTLTTVTGGGGRHYYYQWQGVENIGLPKAVPTVDGVDVLTHNHMAVAPPSKHPETGRYYSWIQAPIAPLPEQAKRALLQFARDTPPHNPLQITAASQASPAQAVGMRRYIDAVTRSVQPGNRNHTLFNLACKCYEENQPVETVNYLRSRFSALGLPTSEIEQTIQSARRRITGKRGAA